MHEHTDGRKRLTAKQRSFAHWYAALGVGTDAARRAGYADTRSITVTASRLLANPHVQEAIAVLRTVEAEVQALTPKTVTNGLSEIARDDSAPHSARVAAWMGIAKLHGFLVDKTEHSGTIQQVWRPHALTDETRALAELGRGLLDGRVVVGEAREVDATFPVAVSLPADSQGFNDQGSDDP